MNNINYFKAFFILLFNYWKRSFHSFFYGLFFPLILIFIFSSAFKNIQIVVPGMIASIGTVHGIIMLPIIYSEFKESIVIKKLRVTPIKEWQIIFIIIFFYFLIGICFTISLILLLKLFMLLKLLTEINWNLNWFSLIIGIIFNSLVSASIGLTLGLKTNNFRSTMILATMINFIFTFFSGQYIPISMIEASKLLKLFSFILPNTWTIYLINHGFNNSTDYLDKIINNDKIYLIYGLILIFIIVLNIYNAYIYKKNKD
jgi:ABC-type multidrug transport system permease subunit